MKKDNISFLGQAFSAVAFGGVITLGGYFLMKMGFFNFTVFSIIHEFLAMSPVVKWILIYYMSQLWCQLTIKIHGSLS